MAKNNAMRVRSAKRVQSAASAACRGLPLVAVMGVAVLGWNRESSAAVRTWDGDTSSTWSTSANWDTLPTNDITTDIATFNLATYNNVSVFNPNLTANYSINGLDIQSTNGDMNLSGGAGVTLTVGGGNITVASANATNISVILAGTTALNKSGNGTLTLSGANTFTGLTTINAGTVSIAAENNLGAAANDVTFGGGTLQITGGFTANSGKIFAVGTSTGTLNIDLNQTLTLNSAGNMTAGTTGTLIKSGSGTLLINAANTAFDGTLRVDSGTVRLGDGSSSPVGDATNRATLTLNGGGVLIQATGGTDTARVFANNLAVLLDGTVTTRLNNAGAGLTYSFNSTTIAANKTLTVDGGYNTTSGTSVLGLGALTLNGNAEIAANSNTTGSAGTAQVTMSTVTGTNTNFTLSGSGVFIITGAITTGTGQLTKNNSGTLRLDTASTYSGDSNLNFGTISNNSTGAIFGTSLVKFNGATYSNSTTTTDRSLSNVISLLADTTFTAATGATSATNTFTGGGTTTGNRIITANLISTRFTTNALVLGGNLTTNGTGAVTFSGGFGLGGSNRQISLGQTTVGTISGPIGSTGIGNTLTLTGTTGANIGTLNLATAGTGGAGNEIKLILNGTNGTEVYTFSGTGSSTGGVDLQSGVIALSTAPDVTAGTLTLAGGTVRSDSTTARTFASPLAIMGSVTLGNATNNGALTFSGAKSITGSNTLTLAGGNVVFSTAALSLASGSNTTFSSAASAVTVSGGVNTNGGTDTLTFNTGSNAVSVSGALSGAGILDLAGNATTITVGTLTGGTTDAVRVSGAGTYIFSGASAFSGGVVLNNAAATVVATSAGNATNNFGTGQVKFNAAGTSFSIKPSDNNSRTLSNGLNSTAFGGTVIVDRAASGAGINITLSGANTFAGNNTVSLIPGSNVTADSSYSLALTGLSTFTGDAVFSISGNGTAAGTLSLSGGFDVSGATRTATFNNGTGTGKATVAGAFTGTGGTLKLAGNVAAVTLNAISDTGANSNAVEFAGSVGTTYTAGSASTYAGGAKLTSGTVNVGDNAAFGIGTVTMNGGTLRISVGRSLNNSLTIAAASTFDVASSNNNALTFGNAASTVNVNSDFVYNRSAAGTLCNLTFNGQINLNTNVTITGNHSNGGGGSGTLNFAPTSGSIAYSANRTLTFNDSGLVNIRGALSSDVNTLTIAGSNNSVQLGAVSAPLSGSTGGIIVDGPTVTIGARQVTPTIIDTPTTFTGGLTVQSGTAKLGVDNGVNSSNIITINGGTFDLAGFNSNNAGLSAATSGGNVNNTGGGPNTLTLSGSGSYSYAGTIAPTTAANIAVTKSGSGTQTLSGTNTYTGATAVTGGKLVVGVGGAGSLANTAVTVASGATLAGSGTIAGATTIDGIVSPGNSIGTLNITNNVTWDGAASAGAATDWVYELGLSNTSDLLNITGNFNKNTGGGTVFRFDFGGATTTGNYVLVDWSGTTSFAASDFSYTNLGTGTTGSFAFNGSRLEFTTVAPEPTGLSLLALGGAALLKRRRRA